MNYSKTIWAILIALLLLGIVGPQTTSCQAQQKSKLSFEVVSQTPLPAAPAGSRRIILEDAKGINISMILAKEGQRVLAIQDRAEVIMPYDLPALVSRNGKVVLQYGDTQDLSHPSVTHLYWLDAQGNETGRLEGYFKADALVSLSDDGFTAVVGSRAEAPQTKVLSLFSATGERIWERPMPAGRSVHAEPVVAEQGRRVAIITTDAQHPLKDHRILILDDKNNEVKTIDTIGVVQRMVVVGKSKTLFVQGRSRHGLINLADGSLAWAIEGNVRLISPTGAAISPGGDVLFLLLADWRGKPQATYNWRLKALDTADGRELGTVQMPKEMPGTRSDLFGQITPDKVDIVTDAEKISVSWTR